MDWYPISPVNPMTLDDHIVGCRFKKNASRKDELAKGVLLLGE